MFYNLALLWKVSFSHRVSCSFDCDNEIKKISEKYVRIFFTIKLYCSDCSVDAI